MKHPDQLPDLARRLDAASDADESTRLRDDLEFLYDAMDLPRRKPWSP
jgi:hypothetical protein